jgi:uncharacterized protein YecE (DUF72 family)
MHTLAGTSGFSYKEWKGTFYPEKIAPTEMLRHYAERLPAVEIDNTFYRLPRADVLAGWAAQVPAAFRFSIKASRRITHLKRLKDTEDETSYLLRVTRALGPKLGAILFQLPPNMKRDRDRLARFLDILPESAPAAFEFREESWFEQEIVELLRERGRPLCLVDRADDETCGADQRNAIVATAGWGYLRLRRETYDDAALRDWAQRIEATGWEQVNVFFKHEDAGAAPALALRFLEVAGTPGGALVVTASTPIPALEGEAEVSDAGAATPVVEGVPARKGPRPSSAPGTVRTRKKSA